METYKNGRVGLLSVTEGEGQTLEIRKKQM